MNFETQSGSARLDAVVLAGSVNRIPLFPGNQPGRKALVPIGGRPLMAYVLDALVAARHVGRILVVGAPEVLAYAAHWPEVEGIPEGRSLVENVWRGLRAGRTERMLYCNPDQPLLRPEMVDHFASRARELDVDLVSSWVRHDAIGRMAEAEHKFCDFGDGRYAHGNLFLVRSELPESCRVRARLDRVYRARKSTVHFAWALGPALFLHFLWSRVTGRLPSLARTLEITGSHFGLSVAPVLSPFPEIVMDVDEPEDFAAAIRYLAPASSLPGAVARMA